MGERGGIGFHTALRQKLRRQLRHGDVVLLLDPPQQIIAMRFEFGVSAPTQRLGSQPTPLAQSHHQVDDERGRHAEMGCGRSSRMARLNVRRNPLTQVHRIGLGHRKSPPTRSESRPKPKRNPIRFNLNARCLSYDFSRRGGEKEPLGEGGSPLVSSEGRIGNMLTV